MRLELRASPVLTVLTGAVHLAAAAILWVTLPHPLGVCAGALTIILSVVAIRNRTLLSGAAAAISLELRGDGGVLVALRSGREIEGQVAARRYVSRWLVVMTLERAPWGHRTLLIARDMLPAGEFRHLRLWALWDAIPARQAACLPLDA